MATQSFAERTVKNSLAGTVAGVAVCLVGHPFDTLKVRLQTQPVHNPVYSGLIDCFVKTIKWEGIGGLYKGVGSPLAGQMIFRATLFTSFYQISALMDTEGNGKRLDSYKYFIAGAVTGGVASFVESPIDLFKTKMQIQVIRAKSGSGAATGAIAYRNVFHAGYVIISSYGFRAAYQGVTGTLLRNIPANGIYFGLFEYCRDHFKPVGGTIADISTPNLFLSGAIAGFFYWFLTYPADVIKSALMSERSDPSKRRFNGIVQCVRYLYREEGGAKRFFRGFTPCLLRSLPANSIMLSVLEKSRQFLAQY